MSSDLHIIGERVDVVATELGLARTYIAELLRVAIDEPGSLDKEQLAAIATNINAQLDRTAAAVGAIIGDQLVATTVEVPPERNPGIPDSVPDTVLQQDAPAT